jgi:hypothetical protein
MLPQTCFLRINHGYEPQGKPRTHLLHQAAGYYTLHVFTGDCSTFYFQFTFVFEN